MLATEAARNPLAPSNMASSYHSRGHVNGGSTSFGSSNPASLPSRYDSGSTTRSAHNGDPQGLFTSPALSTFSPPPPPHTPHFDNNIMNRRAGANSSLFQICMGLRGRLAHVPGFGEHISEMEEEETQINDPTDPVTLMWNCLRRGYPLMTIYNALQPKVPLDVDSTRISEAKLGKAATFQFLQAVMKDLNFAPNETFLITDLYGEDTTGFVKVTKVVNRVLDILEQKGLLIQDQRQRNAGANAGPAEDEKSLYPHMVIQELVTTERDYVQHIEMLQQFQNECQASGAIAGDAIHDMFLNLNAVMDFQRRFLIRIEQQNSLPWVDQNWGRLFAHYRESFRVYEPYIANQNRCTDTVSREWSKLKNAVFSPELQGMVETPAVLHSFLVKPLQRLSKYPMLLRDLRKKGEKQYSAETLRDFDIGIAAAESIMDRANEAVSKEHKIAAVAELQNRVEDWKGHKIDHFGDLLLWGNYTVLKGEGAKEVEREVSTIYDSLDPGTRALVLGTIKWSQCRKARIYLPEAEQIGGSPTQCTVSPMVPQGTGNPRGLLAKSAEVWPEAAPVKHETPEVPQTPLKDPPRNTFRKLLYKSPSVDSLTSPDTPSSARKNQILGMFGASGLITPSPKSEAMLFKRSKLESDTSHLCLYEPEALETTHGSSRLHYFNEVFKKNNLFLYSHDDLPTRLVIRFHSQSDVVSVPDIVPVVPTRLEEEVANDTAIGSPVRVQYKVYLFERILLCCKEINPNKPKNKMLSTNKPLVDKKGKPKLQLKGRIFMQNVTDVLTVKRTDQASHTIQIFWKGDPGVENFVIRFNDEGTMTKWRNRVNEQKQILNTDSSRSSGPAGTSATEFSYLKSQPIGKNPYQEEEIDDDETQSSPPIDAGKSTFTVSRTASSNSLRSTPGPPGNHPVRMAPPKIPLPENGSGVFTPTLSLNTNIPQGTSTPSEFAGHSYFSPSNDSPISTRSNSQQSFSQFPRQHTSGGGWPHEDTRHRTVPVMARAPSREGPEPLHGYSNTRPSLPAMATSKSSQQQMISQSRLRSASTPDITNPNAPGARRPGANQPYLQAENVPVPPIPPHMVQGRPPINRSQTTSPTDAQLPVRSATQSPSQQQRGHRQHPERVRPSFESGYADRPNQHGQTTEADPTSEDYMPNQLKVRIWFHPHPSHVTIVVPTVIKHRSLTDRIDSKMAKVTSASIAKGSARLRYKDSDNDYVTVASDEDIHEAIEDWGTQSRDQLLEGSVPDFELYWYEA